MGRDHRKARQTKVARKLKYFSPGTDLDVLQQELASSGSHSYGEYEVEDPEEDKDLYSKYADFAQEEPGDDSPELDEEFQISPKR